MLSPLKPRSYEAGFHLQVCILQYTYKENICNSFHLRLGQDDRLMILYDTRKKIVINGIWFYGLAGSGKTYASSLVEKITRNSFIIDGDVVRQLISFDLGYSSNERKVQIQRVLGLIQLVTLNKMFPVASSVSMDGQTLKKACDLGILVIKIERPFDQISKIRDIYQKSDNVVGKDIKLDKLDTQVIYNAGNDTFHETIYNLLKPNIERKNAD